MNKDLPRETTVIGSIDERTAQLVVEVVVPDLTSVLNFYENLGFVLQRKTETFAVLKWDSSYLFIAEDKHATAQSRSVNIRIIVPDVNQVWSRINAFGVTVVSPIGNRDYGLRDFVVRDPAGLDVRFASLLNLDS